MATGRSRPGRGAIAVALAALVVTLAPATGVRAAEDDVVILPGMTHTVLAVDLDGDGAGEVVRIRDADTPPAVLEVWRHEGTWSLAGSTRLSLEIDDRWPLPMALVPVRVDGRAIVIVAVGDNHPERGETTCCHAMLDMSFAGGELAVTPRRGLRDAPADSLHPLDMDADGTDELFLSGTRWSDTTTPHGRFRIMRRAGDGWRTDASWRGTPNYGAQVGDTDGLPGEEVLVNLADSGRLERTAWVDGGLRSDVISIGRHEHGGAWLSSIAEDRLVVSEPDGIRVIRWPAGERPERQRIPAPGDFPYAISLGTGSDLRFVVSAWGGIDGTVREVRIFDADLNEIGAAQPGEPASTLFSWFDDGLLDDAGGLSRSLYPYLGPFPMTAGAATRSYAAGGTLIAATPDGFDARPFATIAPIPIGLVGPDDAWVVMGDVFAGWDRAYQLTGFGWGDGQVSIVPVARLEDPAGDPADVSFAFDGAVVAEDTEDGDDTATELLARPDGFTLRIEAPVGSAIVSRITTRVEDHGRVDGPMEIRMRRPGSAESGGRPFEHLVIVIGPDGRLMPFTFTGTYLADAPAVTAEATSRTLELRATVQGTASAGSAVLVDGRPVPTAEDGSFRLEVDAPIWPRDIVVTARDPFGAEVVEVVQVVGLVDYRGWPWAAMLGVLTVAAGLVLFLRIPRRRGETAPVEEGWDGRLEEVDGDVV